MSIAAPPAESPPTSAFHTFSLAAIRTAEAPNPSLSELNHAYLTLTPLEDHWRTQTDLTYKCSLSSEELHTLNETERRSVSFATITYEERRRRQLKALLVQVDFFKGNPPLPCLTEVHTCILTNQEFGPGRITNVFVELITNQPLAGKDTRPISTKVRLSTSIPISEERSSRKTIHITEGFRVMINEYRPRVQSPDLIGR